MSRSERIEMADTGQQPQQGSAHVLSQRQKHRRDTQVLAVWWRTMGKEVKNLLNMQPAMATFVLQCDYVVMKAEHRPSRKENLFSPIPEQAHLSALSRCAMM